MINNFKIIRECLEQYTTIQQIINKYSPLIVRNKELNTKSIPAGCRWEAAILYTPRKVWRYLGGKQARYHSFSWRPRYFPLSALVSIIFRTWSTRSNLWRMSNSRTINNYYSTGKYMYVLAGKGAMIHVCWYLTNLNFHYYTLFCNAFE